MDTGRDMLRSWQVIFLATRTNSVSQVAIAVFIATALGYGIVLPDSAVKSAYARQFSQACKWSAITSLTISAPVRCLSSVQP